MRGGGWLRRDDGRELGRNVKELELCKPNTILIQPIHEPKSICLRSESRGRIPSVRNVSFLGIRIEILCWRGLSLEVDQVVIFGRTL